MKIIHCADIHLGSSLNTNFGSLKAKERNNEILNTFINMIEFAKNNSIDSVLIAGDLFDKKRVSIQTTDTVIDAIKGAPTVRFFYLKGNHDFADLHGKYTFLPTNLYFFNTNWTQYNLSDKVILTGAEFNTVNGQTLQDSLNLDKNKFNIVMLHGDASESITRSYEEIISIKGYRNKGIDYMALGHIHMPRNGKIDERGTYSYPGCLEGRGFDEIGEHGFIILDIDEELGRFNFELHPFARRLLHNPHPLITGVKSISEAEKIIKTELERLNISPNDMIKISLIGELDEDVEINPNLITNYFEDNYYFVKTKDETKTKIDYSRYENDISLKGEFIRNVMNEDNHNQEEKSDIIRCGLRVLSGEDAFD